MDDDAFNKDRLTDLMKQAEQVQDQLVQMQADLDRFEVEGESGAGMVKVVMNCKHMVRKIFISPVLMGEDMSMIGDLVAVAFNDAVKKTEVMIQEKVSGLSQGLVLPPELKLPRS